MRQFADASGRAWVATFRERSGPDYKGRLFLVFRPADEDEGDEVELTEVRWNSARAAERTLSTMSDVELRRRLRGAVGRGLGTVGAAARG